MLLLQRARHIVHCAAPNVIGKERADAVDVLALQRTYSNVLACARSLSLRSVALPAIGVGVNAFPADQAAAAALGACTAFASGAGKKSNLTPSAGLCEIQFWFREQRALLAWTEAAKNYALALIED